MTGPDSPKGRSESAALHAQAMCLVKRLMDMGLPEAHCLLAIEATKASISNFVDRKMCGEFEPK